MLPAWEADRSKGGLAREVIHHMGRRCLNWDYHARCIYQITITLADRSKHLLGELSPELVEAVRAAKGDVSKAEWREILDRTRPSAEQDRRRPSAGQDRTRPSSEQVLGEFAFWAKGYVDTILWREGQLRRMIDYVVDNPRRLAIKRACPELFGVVRDLKVALPGLAGDSLGHFAALGNPFLL